MAGDPAFRRILWHVLAASRGGPNRARILEAVREIPRNAHQLAKDLAVDYKTIQHHLRVLVQNGVLIPSVEDAYGAVYLPTSRMDQNWETFDEIWARLGHK